MTLPSWRIALTLWLATGATLGCGGASRQSFGGREIGGQAIGDPKTAGNPADPQEPEQDFTEGAWGWVDTYRHRAAHVRELQFTEKVSVELLSPATIAARLVEEMAKEEVGRSQQLYQTMGLLALDFDFEATFSALFSEQVVGYYAPDTKRLVVRQDLADALHRTHHTDVADAAHGMAEMTLVHELVHALQDQHYGLGTLMEPDPLTSDAQTGVRMLVEGDATWATVALSLRGTGMSMERLVKQLERWDSHGVSTFAASSVELTGTPAIVRVPLVSAYIDGLKFVAHLQGVGGQSLVNRAFLCPPESTAQVLHPDKYLGALAPRQVPLPDLSVLAEHTPVHEDTLGELEWAVFLGQTSEGGVDWEAARPWVGDQLGMWQLPGGETVVVWVVALEDAPAATRAEAQILAQGRSNRWIWRKEHMLALIMGPPWTSAQKTQLNQDMAAWWAHHGKSLSGKPNYDANLLHCIEHGQHPDPQQEP